MKNLLRKHNPVSRIVALWLVFVMMLVPLISHMGSEKGAKAADKGTLSYTITTDLSGKVTNVTNANNPYKYTYNGGTIDSKTLCYDANLAEINISFTETATGITFNIGDQYYTATTAKSILLADGTAEFVADETNALSKVDAAGTYYVYTKFDYKNDADESITGSTVYVKTGEYTFVNKSAWTDDTAKWYDDEKSSNIDSDSWSKYAFTVKETSGSDYLSNQTDSDIGVIKYAKAVYSATKGEDYTLYNLTWETSPQSAGGPTGAMGTYIGFVGYFTDDGATPVSVKSLGTVKIDKGSPKVKAYLFYNKSGASDWSDFCSGGTANEYFNNVNTEKYDCITTTKYINLSNAYKYRYYVFASDELSGESGIFAVKVSFDGGSTFEVCTPDSNGYYYCTPTVVMDSATVTAYAYDNATNSSNIGVDGKLVEMQESYTLTWSTGNGPLPSEVYVSETNPLSVNVKATTFEKIVKVSITAKVNDSADATEIASYTNTSSTMSGDGYSLNATIDIPTVAVPDGTAKYKDIEVILYVADGADPDSDLDVKKQDSANSLVWYDVNDPVVTFDSEPNTTGWYNTAPTLDFEVSSGDGASETNLNSLTATFGGNTINVTPTFTADSSASYDGAITISEQSTSINGTLLNVTAMDKAGNVGIKEYTIKVDTTKPTLDNLQLVVGSNTYPYTETGKYAGSSSSLKITANDNLSIGKIVFDYTMPNSSDDITIEKNEATNNASKDYTVPITDILGNNLVDGDYSIKVTVYDMAGNKCDDPKTVSFKVDAKKPTYTVEFVSTTDNWTNETVVADTDAHKIVDGKYYIDKINDNREFAYKITITEEGTGVTSGGLLINSCTGGSVTPELMTQDPLQPDTYIVYIKVDKSSLMTDRALDFSFVVVDEAGNPSDSWNNTPKLYAVDSDIEISASICKYENGTYSVVADSSELADIANGTNKQYYVKVSTATPISKDVTKITLYNDNESATIESKSTTGGWDVLKQQYLYDVYFTLPTGSNILFDDWYAKVTFEDDTTQNTTALSTLLYDKTVPVVQKADGTAFVSDNTWYSSKQISFKLLSGTQTDESNITEAFVFVSNSNNDASVSTNNRADGTAVSINGTFDVPESKSVQGTLVQFAAKDNAENKLLVENASYRFLVDCTAPKIGNVSVVSNNKTQDTSKPIIGQPTIGFNVQDNLALDNVEIKVAYPDDKTVKTIPYSYESNQALATGYDGISMNYSYTLEKVDGKLPDGEYTVKITAFDKAGNPASTKVSTFTLDATLPVVTATVSSGVTAHKSAMTNEDGDSYDYYYCTDVGVDFTYFDTNKGTITVTDNGSPVTVSWKADSTGKYKGTYAFATEGTHSIVITGTDQAGNEAVQKTLTFYIDKTAPVVTTVLNGGLVYTESMGLVKMSGDTTLTASVSDVAEDVNDLNIQIVKAVPDQPVSTPEYVKTSARAFTFAEEADYTINLFAIDMAGNQGATRSVKFRLDKTAPALSISGANGGTSSSQTTVSFSMKELFWSDATGSVDIYRKADDDSAETLYKTITITPTGFDTVVSETLTETGEYRFEFTASDWIGHQSEASQTLIIDREAPVLTLTAKKNDASSSEIVKNKESVDVPVYIHVNITDAFYTSKKVTMTGTRVDGDGNVTNLSFGSLKQNANGTAYENIFEEDGQYSLTIVTVDAAGNESTESIQFTIDKAEPVIQDITNIWSGTMTSFEYIDPTTLVSDMTDCEIHMYLNGVEYDGSEDLADGAYTLLITAEDELGHVVEMETSFVIDSTAPVFIVTGVEKDQVKDEAYEIVISLQLETDTLVSVVLNGVEQPIVNNMCAITIDKKGDYTLEVTAMDEAGNTSTDTYEFKYGEEFNWWIIVIIAVAVILLGAIVFIVAKKRKSNR